MAEEELEEVLVLAIGKIMASEYKESTESGVCSIALSDSNGVGDDHIVELNGMEGG